MDFLEMTQPVFGKNYLQALKLLANFAKEV